MALVTQEIWNSGSDGAASVTVTFDDTDGEIKRVDWIVNAGTLTIIVHRDGKADIVLVKTNSGGQNVPANQGYNMTFVSGPKGGWYWQGPLAYEISWHA